MRQPARARFAGWTRIAVILAAVTLPTHPAHAGDLWEILVTNTDGSGVPDQLVTGSSLPNLLENLVNASADFQAFAGVAFSADVSFAGIPNVINVTVDPGTMTGTLTFTILGASAQTFVFSGADLAGQIEQFIQDNLAGQITAFLQAINQLALIAVTDGTPLSTTALSADYVFDRFGLHADLTAWERRQFDAEEFKEGMRARIDTFYNTISTDVGNGNSFSIVPSLEWYLSKEVSIALQIPINYLDVEGSDVYNIHANLAVPIRIFSPSFDSPLGLTITPFATLAGAGSVDLVAGGLIGGGGVLGTVSLDFVNVRLSFSSQLSFHEGITMQYQEFSFDPGVSQQIWKNGLKGTANIGENFYIYGTAIYTQFLQNAAVDSWWSPGAGIGFRKADGSSISVGYSADIGDGYRGDQFRFVFQLPF